MKFTQEQMKRLSDLNDTISESEDVETIIVYQGKECILDEVTRNSITLIHRHTIFSGNMYVRDPDPRCYITLTDGEASDKDMLYVYEQIKKENIRKIRLAEVTPGVSHIILLEGEETPNISNGKFIRYDDEKEMLVYVD